MERGLLALLGLIVGVLLVGSVVVVADWVNDPDQEAPESSFPGIEHDPLAAEGLVAAWERWRNATFVSEGTWTRTLDGVEEPLTGPVYIAQDPPRRLVVRLGSTVEEIDGTVASCDISDDDMIISPCLAGDSGQTFAERVEDELGAVKGYFDAPRLYSAARGEPGCYQVELVSAMLAAPWGRWAEFCFDPASGVLSSARVRRPTAIDVESVTFIRTEVSDSDFG